MPKFGKMWFNGYYFGDDVPVWTSKRDSIQRLPLGMSVRRSIRKVMLTGTRHEVWHTTGGIPRVSIYYTDAVYDNSRAVTFRIRRGNGAAGSILGKRIQDKYKYFVPSSINNAEGQDARDAFAQAVSNWQTVLTDSQKVEYNRRANKGLHMSGYNLYIREYVKANA